MFHFAKATSQSGLTVNQVQIQRKKLPGSTIDWAAGDNKANRGLCHIEPAKERLLLQNGYACAKNTTTSADISLIIMTEGEEQCVKEFPGGKDN